MIYFECSLESIENIIDVFVISETDFIGVLIYILIFSFYFREQLALIHHPKHP
jgi:hypothetical protein